MGQVKRLPELESWLTEHSVTWTLVTDVEYESLIRAWISTFRPIIESRGRYLSGRRAMKALESRLPCNVAIFSGLRIRVARNAGGRGLSGYNVESLSAIDISLARQLELIVVADNLAWGCSLSHEEGYEKFYEEESTDA